eukprot:1280797-Pyramimonas_sp.AAC.1
MRRPPRKFSVVNGGMQLGDLNSGEVFSKEALSGHSKFAAAVIRNKPKEEAAIITGGLARS